eukprot:SAG22_NODE_6756_length_815_cov_0.935754_1_plen_105_part_10
MHADFECPHGGFCETASDFTLCPAGTYGNKSRGVDQQDACRVCEAGSYCLVRRRPFLSLPFSTAVLCCLSFLTEKTLCCLQAGTVAATMQTCPRGYVCPAGAQLS